MRKTIFAIALASGCLVGLQSAAFAAQAAAAPQTLDSNDLARLQGTRTGNHTRSHAPRLYNQVSPEQSSATGGYDNWVTVPSAIGH